MEVFYNELSINPKASDEIAAKLKVKQLLDTLKALRSFQFNIMRTHDAFYTDEIAEGYTIMSFINDPAVSKEQKILLQSIARNPFIPEANSYEADVYINTAFKTKSFNNTDIEPEGIAAAYVYNSPVVSLGGFELWESETLRLEITNTNELVANIINLHTTTSVTNKTFTDWLNSLTGNLLLNTAENITLTFSPTQFQFENQAVKDIISWYYDDPRYIVRIKQLINDIVENPFTGGIGLTEVLAGSEGMASKRIAGKDRILYTYTKEIIIIHQCKGHYSDH